MTNSEIIFPSSSDQGACISVLSTIEVDFQFNSKKKKKQKTKESSSLLENRRPPLLPTSLHKS